MFEIYCRGSSFVCRGRRRGNLDASHKGELRKVVVIDASLVASPYGFSTFNEASAVRWRSHTLLWNESSVSRGMLDSNRQCNNKRENTVSSAAMEGLIIQCDEDYKPMVTKRTTTLVVSANAKKWQVTMLTSSHRKQRRKYCDVVIEPQSLKEMSDWGLIGWQNIKLFPTDSQRWFLFKNDHNCSLILIKKFLFFLIMLYIVAFRKMTTTT